MAMPDSRLQPKQLQRVSTDTATKTKSLLQQDGSIDLTGMDSSQELGLTGPKATE
jgi:hypothetical protein